MEISISLLSRAKYIRYFVIAQLSLLVMFSSALLAEETFGKKFLSINRRFYYDVEISLPTLVNYGILLFNCFLALVVFRSKYHAHGTKKYYWLGLAILFFFMAYDEVASIHEKAIDPMRNIFNHPLFHFAWTPVGFLIAMLVAFLFIPFLLRLDKRVSKLMIFAGFIYLIGAIFIETIGGFYDFHYEMDWKYHCITAIEETLEMSGQAIFGYAILLHISIIEARMKNNRVYS